MVEDSIKKLDWLKPEVLALDHKSTQSSCDTDFPNKLITNITDGNDFGCGGS